MLIFVISSDKVSSWNSGCGGFGGGRGKLFKINGSYWGGGGITGLSYYSTDLKFLQFLLTGRGSRGGGGDFKSFSSGA